MKASYLQPDVEILVLDGACPICAQSSTKTGNDIEQIEEIPFTW